MNHEDRCLIGKLAKDCDNKRTELEFDDNGMLVGFKMYGRAKDFRGVNKNGCNR